VVFLCVKDLILKISSSVIVHKNRNKLKKRNVIIQALLTIMMFLQGVSIPYGNSSVNGKPGLYIFLPIALIILAVLNISSYFHIKNVDQSSTNLKGYANRTMLYGIVGGSVLGGIITWTIVISNMN